MGPYCKFCDHRCFRYMPLQTPKHILDAYTNQCGSIPIIATCSMGQAFEREKLGYCSDDIDAWIREHPETLPGEPS